MQQSLHQFHTMQNSNGLQDIPSDSHHSYALMLRKLELEKEKSGELDAYCVHEQKLLLMAVTYRLCSIFSASFKAAGKEMERKIAIFESLVLLIEKNYMRERSVAFYADELCLTPKYLSVLVESVCGQTVQQLLFKAMIRRSIYLMKNTTKTIQQIANELSFPNASAFGTFFKKHTGLSPKTRVVTRGKQPKREEATPEQPKREVKKQEPKKEVKKSR